MVSDYDKKLAEKMIYYIEEAYTIMKMINTKEDKEEIKIRYMNSLHSTVIQLKQ